MAFSLTNFVAQHQRPAVIVPMMATSWRDLQAFLAAVQATPIDVIEWRVDAALAAGWLPSRDEMQAAVISSQQPILFTWRTQAEGGLAAFDAGLFAQVYDQALQAGVWAIDVEFALREQLSAYRTWLAHEQVVLSYHDFSGVPADLTQHFQQMAADQPAVVKMAVTPVTPAEVSTIMALPQTRPEQTSIVIGMGEIGQTTRVNGWQYGSQATFAALDEQHASAPGQLTWQHLWTTWTAK